jgi:putative transposase
VGSTRGSVVRRVRGPSAMPSWARWCARASSRAIAPTTTAPVANVLDRQFTASAPNEKWVADFTYVWTSEGWLFVAVVLDLFSRRIVGWAMQADMTTQLVTDALMMAVWRRGGHHALLHHSDRGSQYTADTFQRLLRDLGVTCSMSRSGNVWDYRTRNEARADVFEYIERFYNPVRRHSTLGYLSPIRYEEQAQAA